MDDIKAWRIDIVDGAEKVFDTVLVMQQPGNDELSIVSSSHEHRCFLSLSLKSSQGYTVVGDGIVLENDRSDETKWLSIVVWKANSRYIEKV